MIDEHHTVCMLQGIITLIIIALVHEYYCSPHHAPGVFTRYKIISQYLRRRGIFGIILRWRTGHEDDMYRRASSCSYTRTPLLSPEAHTVV